ncbi:MAG: hypothetical protein ACE5NG_20315, partial [bacterium]
MYHTLSCRLTVVLFCLFLTPFIVEGQPQTPGNVLSYKKETHGLSLICEQANVEISILDSSIVHVHVWKDKQEEKYSPAIVARDFDYPRFSFQDQGHLILSTGRISGRIEKNPFRIAFLDERGNILLQDIEAAAAKPDTIGKTLSWAMQPDEHFYGLGHKVRGPNRTDLSWRGHVRDFGPFGNTLDSVNKSFPSNIDAPILYGTKGWALFLDNVQKKTWDFTNS